jgi:hypothetical protein
MQGQRSNNDRPPEPNVPLPEDTTVTRDHRHADGERSSRIVPVVLAAIFVMTLGLLWIANP